MGRGFHGIAAFHEIAPSMGSRPIHGSAKRPWDTGHPKVYRSGAGTVYPPTKRDLVLVFFNAEDVKRPYEVIGEILAEGSSGWGMNDSSLVSKAQEKAAGLGAHAIIVTKEKGATATSAMLLGSNDRKQRIQAIRFTDNAVTGPPKSP